MSVSVSALIRDAASGRWLACAEPVTVLEALRPTDVRAVVDEAEDRARRNRLHAIGYLTYEAAAGFTPELRVHDGGVLPLTWFALFDDARPVAEPAAAHMPDLTWEASLDPDAYRQAVAAIRRYVGAGDTYQLNFSYRLRAALAGHAANLPRTLFHAMVARQPAGLGAFIETGRWAVCCASHELFFSRRGDRLVSRPMKGTAPRGASPREDARHAAWLKASPKNRAENLMITDMVRNDIGRLAAVGSVRAEALFELEAYPTVWQLTSTVEGRTGAGLSQILEALFPAASITGAPKRRTMEIIHDLEPEPREIYTGTVGMIGPDGDAQFNVAIRTAWVDKQRQQAEYGVGGGILWDSDADEELEETRTKARILRPGGAPPLCLLETLLWQPDTGYWLLGLHLDRLQSAAGHFFDATVDPQQVVDRLESLSHTLTPHPHRVRLLVDAAGGIHVTAALLEPANRPRRVTLARVRRDLIGNPLVHNKTTRRDIYEAARCEALAVPEADEVLLLNQRGEVTECTIANLVVDLEGVLVTPPAASGLLPGVYRRYLLETGRVAERVLFPEDVRRASAVYLANSVRGLWEVTLVR